MLDQLPDTDSVLEPKSTAQSGGVAGSPRHLTPEDLEAYANGRLASARLDHCRIHLESCDACRAELEDLRILKSELSGFQRSEPSRRELERRKKRRGLPLAVSVATIVVVAGAAIFWWERGSLWKSKTSAAVSVRQPAVASAGSAAVVAPPTPAAALKRTAPPAPATAPAEAAAVSAAIQRGNLQLPTDASGLHQQAPPNSRAPAANTEFALLGPFGEAITETRPEFS